MDPNDYPSDSDASDEDFRPDHGDNDSGSEIESDDNITDHNENGNAKSPEGAKKRKKLTGKAGRKKSKVETRTQDTSKSEPKEGELDEEEEKRKTDALWADFLAGTGSSTESSSKSPTKNSGKESTSTGNSTKSTKSIEPFKTVTKVFEFAGEAVEVTENIPTTQEGKVLVKPSLATVSSNMKSGPTRPLLGRPSSGGLGAVLNQIGKKNKLSTLEKTKLDWNSFKRTEGIEEELQTHNKGKNGYLEKQDFLDRADLRQFEIEKSIRQTSRSNR
ncbi:craniofacial development protein 1 [Malaya genurostris]|uniref:craniofacial development protein 1 n=1 Tax=Malaya genurostris TaxID=325434 RepID=UPI0026F3D01D|nr:craniofacial development protein 1 [Malaya genurostris]